MSGIFQSEDLLPCVFWDAIGFFVIWYSSVRSGGSLGFLYSLGRSVDEKWVGKNWLKIVINEVDYVSASYV